MRQFRIAGLYFAQVFLLVAIVLAAPFSTCLAVTSSSTGPFTPDFPDVQGHWASGAIYRLAELGVIHGDSRGFRPDDPITLAEMAVLLNNLLGFSTLAGGPLPKSGAQSWYGQALQGATLAGLIKADATRQKTAKDLLMWEQAAVILARALGVEENAGNETAIENAGEIELDNQLMVFGMEADGYLGGGDPSGFAPKSFATRAQVVAIIDRAIIAFYSEAGLFDESVKPVDGTRQGITIVRAGGTTFRSMTIEGTLIIAEGLAGGSFTLDNSVVTGNLVVRSGAGSSIDIINGSEVHGRMSFQSAEGAAKAYSNTSGPLNVDVKSEAALQGSFSAICTQGGSYLELDGKAAAILVTGKAQVFVGKAAEVGTITLYEGAAGSIVDVDGIVNMIIAEARDVSIFAGRSAKIAAVDTKPGAVGTDIFLNRYAQVERVGNATSITVSGSGLPQIVEGSGMIDYLNTLDYENPQYGFIFNLPRSWNGYSIVITRWLGSGVSSSGAFMERSGPIISIRHPEWTEASQRQDIPIMVFDIADWDLLQEGQFHIGAAPIGPSELGRNSKYVFALPARYNFAFPEGFEEVERILSGDPLLATVPGN